MRRRDIARGLDFARWLARGAHMRFERLHVSFQPIDTLDEALDCPGHGVQQFGRIRLTQRVRPGVVRSHRPATRQQPVGADS